MICTKKCGPNALISTACVRNVSGACASGNCAYGTSPAAIRVAMFRTYERSTRTPTCVVRQKVNAALAAQRSTGTSTGERPKSAARPAPNTAREYRWGLVRRARSLSPPVCVVCGAAERPRVRPGVRDYVTGEDSQLREPDCADARETFCTLTTFAAVVLTVPPCALGLALPGWRAPRCA